MDRLITTTPGGYPLVLDDIRFFLGQSGQSQGIYQALNNLLRLFGDNFIIQGVATFGGGVREGWIMFEGELLKVDEHLPVGSSLFFSKVTTDDPAGDKKAQNGSDIQAYQVNRGVVNASSGSLSLLSDRFEDLIIPAIRNQTNSKATELQNGLIEIATQAEADAGTDDTRAITPKKLDIVQGNKADKVSGATTDNLAGLDSSGNLQDSGVAASQVPANTGNITNLIANKLDKSEFTQLWASLSSTSLIVPSGSPISSIDSGNIRHFTIGEFRILDFDIQLTLTAGYSFGDNIEFDLPSSFTADNVYRSSGFWEALNETPRIVGSMSIELGVTSPRKRIVIFDRGGLNIDGGIFDRLNPNDQVTFHGQLTYKLTP